MLCALAAVAPLAGSVDRNKLTSRQGGQTSGVAPLAGSVDRNKKLCRVSVTSDRSLPSRGAWIEIGGNYTDANGQKVAPLAGSVDRNSCLRSTRLRP